MLNTEEQRIDIIENCQILLKTVLHPFTQTDDTPEGRMIAQLKWLKERAENSDLPLPVDPIKLSTLRRIYVDGELCRHASTPDKVHQEIEIYMDRLLSLTKKAQLLFKPPYYPYGVRCIEALIALLVKPQRRLSQYEYGLIEELKQLKQLLLAGKIAPPLESYLPNYPNFREVYSITGNSTDDLKNGKFLTETVAQLLFEGVRPASWITTDAADKETASL